MTKRWFVHPIRVRYQETDQMGVVFHGNYVTWFEIGRTEWIRGLGYTYSDIERKGLLFPVIDLAISYSQPAKYDDTVIVCTQMKDFSPLRMEFSSQVRRVTSEHFSTAFYEDEDQLPGELLVYGGTKHVWVNESFHPMRLSRAIPELYKKLTLEDV